MPSGRMVLLDTDGRVQLVNDEARRLLALDDSAVGRTLGDLDLPTAFVERAGSQVEVWTRSSWCTTRSWW